MKLTNVQFRSFCKWGSRLSLLGGIFVAVLGVLVLIAFLLPPGVESFAGFIHIKIEIGKEGVAPFLLKMPPFGRVLYGGMGGMYFFLTAAFCWTLRQLLRTYAMGHYFDPIVPGLYQWLFIYVMLIWFVDHPLYEMVGLFVAEVAPATKDAWLSSSDGGGITAIALALLFFILSRIMAEGVRMQEEQNLTV